MNPEGNESTYFFHLLCIFRFWQYFAVVCDSFLHFWGGVFPPIFVLGNDFDLGHPAFLEPTTSYIFLDSACFQNEKLGFLTFLLHGPKAHKFGLLFPPKNITLFQMLFFSGRRCPAPGRRASWTRGRRPRSAACSPATSSQQSTASPSTT